MPGLKERLHDDLVVSMKARDALRSSTLRMALAAITNAEVAGKQPRRLTDEQVVDVLSSQAKQRREAATAFDGAGRTELAAKERAELAILSEYLPEQLDEEAIAGIVAEAIARTGSAGAGMSAMGRVMGAAQPRVKGRADGSAVAAEVRRQLGR
jgi:uncharacterized protein